MGFQRPMLATLGEGPFDDPEWIFEIKWDGFRALADVKKSRVQLYSRNALRLNDRFPNVVAALQNLKRTAVLDGEVVILDERGVSHFQLLQNYQKTRVGMPVYYVFDILSLDGKDLRQFPLVQRKEFLRKLLASQSDSCLKYSDHVVGAGKTFFKAAAKQKLEGVMAKKANSAYLSTRTRDWLKIKVQNRQEMVICGFTVPQGGRHYFGSLALGVYQKGKLVYAGNVGTGFNDAGLKEVYQQLIKLKTEECPFTTIPKGSRGTTWVKPKLVCEVSFAQWTADGQLRHSSFKGMRNDKDAKEVVRES